MQEEEGDGSYGESYWNDSCGYNVHEANDGYNKYYHGDDGYGEYYSGGEYACANIENYNDGSCGYTSYEGEYRCWHNEYDGNHCENEYGGYYNYCVGARYEPNYPPTDDDSGPTSREGGRGHQEEEEMCGIATHTPNMATRLERITEEVIKATKHLAQKKEISPHGTKAIE